MSRTGISNFNWPTAAPGAPDQLKSVLDQAPTLSAVTTIGMYTTSKSLETHLVSKNVHSAAKNVHVIVASTVTYDATANSHAASLIHQTNPLSLHAPVVPTSVRVPGPDLTAVAFELYTPSADPSVSVLADVTPTKSNSGSTPNPLPSNTGDPDASDHFGVKIAGIAVGSVAFIIIVGLALVFWQIRRSHHVKDSESASPDMEAAIEVKRQRAHHLGLDRWSRQDTKVNLERFKKLKADAAAMNAEKKYDTIVEGAEDEVFVIGEEIRECQTQKCARRPSGLAMHPPTPVTAEFEGGKEHCVGQAFHCTTTMSSETPNNAEDRKVGPIPLPWFIPMCIFIPSFLTMLGYFTYLKTVKKYKDKKQLAKQDEETATGEMKEAEVSKAVEMQVRAFLDVPLNK